jgi:WD40-like Beta Propeller Repeat
MEDVMKKILVMFILFVLMLSNNLFSQNWLYLGQTPPGMNPERFPPVELQANADWWWHSSPIFSPAGDEMFFVKYYAAQSMEMNYMKVENGEWTEAEPPWFVTPDYADNCPIFSATGDTLYFLSTRPGGFIFMTTKVNDDWTAPVALQIPIPTGFDLGWQFSINKNRDIYLESDSDLYCTRFIGGNYQTPEALPAVINTSNSEFCPYIDSEDNFILFSSNRPGSFGFHDIYISSKDDNGNWTEAVNLGSEINTDNEEAFAFFSYDNLYFFFTTQHANDLGYNPYWVDVQVIFDMITDVDPQEIIPNSEISLGNYPNPFNPSTTISFQLNTEITESTELMIYNLKGQKIKTLTPSLCHPEPVEGRGEMSVIWNGTDQSNQPVSSGIYYYKLNHPNSPVNKMVLMK